MAGEKTTMGVSIIYAWDGKFRDELIEQLLGEEAHSSGCGFGERDLDFDLPVTHETIKKLRALQEAVDVRLDILPNKYPCHFCKAFARLTKVDNGAGQMLFRCDSCGAGRAVYPAKLS